MKKANTTSSIISLRSYFGVGLIMTGVLAGGCLSGEESENLGSTQQALEVCSQDSSGDQEDDPACPSDATGDADATGEDPTDVGYDADTHGKNVSVECPAIENASAFAPDAQELLDGNPNFCGVSEANIFANARIIETVYTCTCTWLTDDAPDMVTCESEGYLDGSTPNVCDIKATTTEDCWDEDVGGYGRCYYHHDFGPNPTSQQRANSVSECKNFFHSKCKSSCANGVLPTASPDLNCRTEP